MKNLLKFCILFSLLLPTLQAKEKIKWLIWELAPEFISHGKEAGKGYADKFLKTFIKNLPEYEHEIVWLNTRRWFLESSKKGRCTPHIWKHFKLEEQHYSKAYTLTPPHGILIHKKDIYKFGKVGKILSLENILKNKELMLTVPLFRYKEEGSRYPILYKYFKPYIGKKNLQEVTSNTNEITPIMLDKNRTDYLIAYPTTATAYARIKEKENNYQFYNIKEDPYYKKIHVSCDRSTLGKEIISKIDAMMTKELQEQFLFFHEEWNNGDIKFREKYINYFIHSIDDEFIIQ